MKTERAVQERAATRPTDVRFQHKADLKPTPANARFRAHLENIGCSPSDNKRRSGALAYVGYCFAGPGAAVPAAGFLSFCWAIFFFGGGFTNLLKQLRRSSSSFT